MSSDTKNLDIKALPELGSQLLQRLSRYRVLLFILFIVLIYGFIGYRIYSLANPPSDSSSVQTQVTTLTPHIDPKVVQQLNSLQDNSVSVQALFDQARNNPFAE